MNKFVLQEATSGEFLKKGREYEGETTDKLKEASIFFTPKSAKHAAKRILKTEQESGSWLVQDREIMQNVA